MLELRSRFTTNFRIEDAKQRLLAGVQRGSVAAGKMLMRELVNASLKDPLTGRTGDLARSWKAEPVEVAGNHVTLAIDNYKVYANILQRGGTIVPKTAKMLAIPVQNGPAVTARGLPRYPTAREAYEAEHLFVWTDKTTGNLFLAKGGSPQGPGSPKRRQGPKDRLQLWYVLRDQVKIPAFRYASTAIERGRAAALKEMARLIAESLAPR